MTHWATKYIGIPWEQAAQGPYAYDCWGFFRMVQREHFNIVVPLVLAPDYNDSTALVNLFSRHEENHHWSAIAVPQDGDAVIIHRPFHIGVWLDIDGGGVLHCIKGIGVIYTRNASWLLSGFGRREYKRYIGT